MSFKFNQSIFRAIILVCVIALAGCATPVKHATMSGKPEVTIHGASKSSVKERLVSEMVNRGYTPNKADDTILSFDRPITDAMASMFLGSGYDSQPNARIVYTLVKNKDAVRVIADCAVITNPHSAFERRSDMNQAQETTKIQAMLDSVKADLGRK